MESNSLDMLFEYKVLAWMGNLDGRSDFLFLHESSEDISESVESEVEDEHAPFLLDFLDSDLFLLLFK